MVPGLMFSSGLCIEPFDLRSYDSAYLLFSGSETVSVLLRKSYYCLEYIENMINYSSDVSKFLSFLKGALPHRKNIFIPQSGKLMEKLAATQNF